MPANPEAPFTALPIAILTISDTRTFETDKSGAYLIEALTEAGHSLYERALLADHLYQIRARLSQWIADPDVRVVICTGGTGFSNRDVTPDAVAPLLDKTVEGFGELFRSISRDQIGTSTVQSRAIAGLANGTFIFCLPGSVNACRTAWEEILKAQLDNRTTPCNFAELLPNISQEGR